MDVAAGDAERAMAERGLEHMQRGPVVERLAGMGVPEPVGLDREFGMQSNKRHKSPIGTFETSRPAWL